MHPMCTGLPALPLKASASTLKMDIRALLVWAERNKPVSHLEPTLSEFCPCWGGMFCFKKACMGVLERKLRAVGFYSYNIANPL